MLTTEIPISFSLNDKKADLALPGGRLRNMSNTREKTGIKQDSVMEDPQ